MTAVSPLRVKLDGDTAALAFEPDSLVDPAALAVNDRVRCELSDRRLVIVGRSGGENIFRLGASVPWPYTADPVLPFMEFDGRSLSYTEYPEMFALCGTDFGTGVLATITNLSPNPAAVDTSNFTSNASFGSVSAVSDFPTFTTAVRHTRTNTGIARFTHIVGTAFLASTEYTVVMQVRASEELTSVAVQYRHVATAGGDVVDTVTIPAGVSEIRVTGTRSSTAAEASAGTTFVFSSGSVGSTLDITRIQVIEGPTAGAYFDGDTTDTSEYEYAWTGSANASSSTQDEIGFNIPDFSTLEAATVGRWVGRVR